MRARDRGRRDHRPLPYPGGRSQGHHRAVSPAGPRDGFRPRVLRGGGTGSGVPLCLPGAPRLRGRAQAEIHDPGAGRLRQRVPHGVRQSASVRLPHPLRASRGRRRQEGDRPVPLPPGSGHAVAAAQRAAHGSASERAQVRRLGVAQEGVTRPMSVRAIPRAVLTFLALACLAPSARPADPTAGDATARVEAIFASYTADTPGCAVGVSKDGKEVLARAYGSADLEHGVANTPDTIFEAGSVSKQFTAAAILLLAQAGKLKLDDPVDQYVPELPDYGTPIT